jgi:hypothetical protein
MSPQAVAGMTSDIKAGNRADKQNGLRKCANTAAAFDVPNMCEAMIKTPSPVKQIPIKKV